MMEGMYYPGQRFLTVTEKSMKNWVGMNNFVFFFDIYNRCLSRAWNIALSRHVTQYDLWSGLPY